MKLKFHPLLTMTISAMLLSLLSGCGPSLSREAGNTDSNPPQVLTVVEESDLAVSSSCASGAGMRIIHGIDYNHDGRLGPYERKRLDIICPPAVDAENAGAVASLQDAPPIP